MMTEYTAEQIAAVRALSEAERRSIIEYLPELPHDDFLVTPTGVKCTGCGATTGRTGPPQEWLDQHMHNTLGRRR